VCLNFVPKWLCLCKTFSCTNVWNLETKLECFIGSLIPSSSTDPFLPLNLKKNKKSSNPHPQHTATCHNTKHKTVHNTHHAHTFQHPFFKFNLSHINSSSPANLPNSIFTAFTYLHIFLFRFSSYRFDSFFNLK
jgi:hypothetical protein